MSTRLIEALQPQPPTCLVSVPPLSYYYFYIALKFFQKIGFSPQKLSRWQSTFVCSACNTNDVIDMIKTPVRGLCTPASSQIKSINRQLKVFTVGATKHKPSRHASREFRMQTFQVINVKWSRFGHVFQSGGPKFATWSSPKWTHY